MTSYAEPAPDGVVPAVLAAVAAAVVGRFVCHVDRRRRQFYCHHTSTWRDTTAPIRQWHGASGRITDRSQITKSVAYQLRRDDDIARLYKIRTGVPDYSRRIAVADRERARARLSIDVYRSVKWLEKSPHWETPEPSEPVCDPADHADFDRDLWLDMQECPA